MRLRNIFLTLCLIGTFMCQAQSASAPATLFPYPTAPDELETLSDRTNYLVTHFWDRCPMQSAILKRDEFKKAFLDYISFMPYAEAHVTHESIDKLIAAYSKQPEHMLTLAELAEEAVYNGESDFVSDEIFLAFANPVIENKKINKTKKARIAHEAKVVGQTQVGQPAPELNYTLPDGTKGNLSSTKGSHVLLFVNDPDCEDCMMARVRLSADNNINDLLDSGLLKIVSIYPGDYSAEWAQQVANYNKRWIIGACPDIDEIYDLRSSPALYYLNPKGEILSKTLDVSNLLEAFRHVNNKITK